MVAASCCYINVVEGSASSCGSLNLQLWWFKPPAVVVIISSCGRLNLQLHSLAEVGTAPAWICRPQLNYKAGMRALNNLPLAGPPAPAASDAAL